MLSPLYVLIHSHRLNTSPCGHGVASVTHTEEPTMKFAIALVIGLPIAAHILTMTLQSALAPLLRVLGQ